MMTPEMAQAFKDLGVDPDADATTIRKAWRALVRTYHPDQVRGDKVAANARLARLNAAYDLVSAWTPTPNAPRPAPNSPRPNPSRPRPKARNAGKDAAHRAAQAAGARQRAADLERQDAARAAARAAAAKAAAARAAASRPAPRETPETRAARSLFLAALNALRPKAAVRTLAWL